MRRVLNSLPKERKLLTVRSFLAGLCTSARGPPEKGSRFLPRTEEECEEEDDESISLSSRLYWSQKISNLCTAAEPDVEAALSLLDRLHARGYRPDSGDLVSVVLALCRVGRFSEAHKRLLLSPTLPDHQTCNLLLSQLLRANTPQLTTRLLHRFIAADSSFTPSLITYNRLIHQFGCSSEPNEARDLFCHLQNRGLSPNAVTYTSLIGAYCRNGDSISACKVFEEMREKGVTPNSLTYSVLCRGFLDKRETAAGMQLVSELWVRMREDDPSVNSAAFANVIDTLCRNKLFQEVFRIAEEMPQGSHVCEHFAYGQVIDSLCKAGRNHAASRIVYIMRKRGVVPCLASYNSIIHGLSKEGEGGCMRAYQLFEEGVGFGYFPPEPTYKVLVEGLCRLHDVGKARNLVDFMLQQTGADKTRIYNIFLSSLCLTDRPSELLNVLFSMLQNGCQPDIVTLNTVIHGFCKRGRVDEATKVFHDMLMGNFCSPDVFTFTALMSGLLDAERTEEALDVFYRKMPESCCKPNLVTYNAMLRGLCKSQKIDEAMDIFKAMVADGVSADSTTYTTIIDGLCATSRIEAAKRYWEEIIWPSGVHDDFVYAALIKGLCNADKLSEALDFLYELVDCGVRPQIVNYNILIGKACSMGMKRQAYQILKEMKENAGLEPDAVTWRTLDKLHGKSRKMFDENMESTSVAESRDTLDLERDQIKSFLQEEETASNEDEIDVELPAVKQKVHAGKEIRQTGVGEDPLIGLVDSNFTNQWEEDTRTFNSIVKESIKLPQTDKREPLSKVARRVFGLL